MSKSDRVTIELGPKSDCIINFQTNLSQCHFGDNCEHYFFAFGRIRILFMFVQPSFQCVCTFTGGILPPYAIVHFRIIRSKNLVNFGYFKPKIGKFRAIWSIFDQKLVIFEKFQFFDRKLVKCYQGLIWGKNRPILGHVEFLAENWPILSHAEFMAENRLI